MSTTATATESSDQPLPHARTKRQAGPRVGKRVMVAGVLVIALIIAGILAWPKIVFIFTHETTDDAKIDGRLSPVLARVPGYVSELLVTDNQHVTAGQVLLKIDTRDYDTEVAEAEASLAQAKADLAAKQTLLAVVAASVQADEITLKNKQDNYASDQALFAKGALNDRALADSRTTAQSAAAQHLALERQIDAVQAQIHLSETVIAQREASLAAAQLKRSYTTVVAPASGFVSRRAIESGQYVPAGTPLLAITGDSDVWVTANFKETQLTDMKPGQPVVFSVDTFPGVEFHGTVDSIAGATGSTFALLPPDNATGNFVKITQRVPVKIRIAPSDAEAARRLRLGLSADVSVRIAE